MTNDPIIKIEQLEKSFGDLHVLKGINLEVDRGEVVCIIGASGSGKSTLLRCINLLEEADSGHIWFDGQDLMDLKVDLNALRQKIGMVFQGFNLFNNKSVLDNCTLAPMTVRHIPRAQAEETAIRHLKAVGLEDFIHAASPAGRSSVSPSRGRFAWSPRSCSSTSRRAPSTPRSWARCSM